MDMHEQAGLILAVDDNPVNLDILMDLLRPAGFKVHTAPSGRLAFESARLSPPDLVLLDIRMPGMDGFEVCERLKADPVLREIPVIFLSALENVEDKIRAFRSGGTDYLTKPFQTEEVLVRVRHHIQLTRLRRELQEKNRALEEANAELTRLDRMKSQMTSMLVHDLRSPLGAILMALEDHLDENPEMAPALGIARKAVLLIDGMLKDLMDVYRSEQSALPLEPEATDLLLVAREKVALNAQKAERKEITLELVEPSEPPPPVMGDATLIGRALDNLIGNAVKFTPKGGSIRIHCEPVETIEPGARRSGVALRVEDTGRGIPADKLPFVFDPFRQVLKDEAGFGLGLAIVQRIMTAHKGRVTVESTVGAGTVFSLLYPLQDPLP